MISINVYKKPTESALRNFNPIIRAVFILICKLIITKGSVLVGVRLIIVKRYRFNNGSSEVLRIRK
jgi:hypothetical protein